MPELEIDDYYSIALNDDYAVGDEVLDVRSLGLAISEAVEEYQEEAIA